VGRGEGSVLALLIISNARDVVIASKQNYIIGAKYSKYRKGPCFPTPLPIFYFCLEIYFEAPREKT
jgi:hypothetical protein